MRMLLILFLLLSLTWAESPEEIIAKQNRIKELQKQVETLRDERDRLLAKRWQDKQKANDFREDFNVKLDSRKSRIERALYTKNQLLDQFRSLKSESAGLRENREKRRDQFLFLSDQGGKVDELRTLLERSSSLGFTEHLEALNSIQAEMEINRDKPEVIAEMLMKSMENLLDFQSEIKLERREILNSQMSSSMGYRLRVGGLYASRVDEQGQDGALLLAGNRKNQKVFQWKKSTDPQMLQSLKKEFSEIRAKGKGVLWAPMDVLLSPNLQVDQNVEEEQTISSWVKKTLQDGGVLSWPIIVLFILAILFAVERLIVWRVAATYSKKKLESIIQNLGEGKFEEAKAGAKTLGGVVGKMARVAVDYTGQSREEAENHIEEVFLKEVPALEKRLNTISVLGGAAPLLGLLGTVFGMIQLFDVITLYGTSDPKLLAGGISVALVTTQMGLMVAIPVQLLHNFVRNRIQGLLGELDRHAVRILNAGWKK